MNRMPFFGVLLLIIALSGCTIMEIECKEDTDCTTAGCSGELCLPKEKAKGLFTACVWKREFECLSFTSCKCIDGRCTWERTKEYVDCLSKINDSR